MGAQARQTVIRRVAFRYLAKLAKRERRDFTDTDVEDALKRADHRCECTLIGCDPPHEAQCEEKLALDERGNWGDPDAWQADHKNGDRSDNSAENCQVLCSNCHIEKTFSLDVPA